MPAEPFRIKRRVWVGLAVALAGIAGWIFLVRAQRVAPAGQGRGSQPFVRLAGAGTATTSKILKEKAELMDPTPLFFPTEWNYGQRPLRDSQVRQPGQVFGSFDPKLTVPEQNLTPFGLEAAPVPEKLSDVLVQGNGAPFAGMGQVDIQKSTLPARAGYLEIRRLDSNESIVSQSLMGIQPPRTDFSPVEFLIVVASGGIVGEPILASGSGWDEVDAFFRVYLVKSYHVGERLPPGRYRVVVGA